LPPLFLLKLVLLDLGNNRVVVVGFNNGGNKNKETKDD